MLTVDRGVTLLDREVPGWEQSVNTNTLALENCERCVLGQVFGSYRQGLHELGLDHAQASRFGFNVFGPGRFQNLTRAWRRVIESRRSS